MNSIFLATAIAFAIVCGCNLLKADSIYEKSSTQFYEEKKVPTSPIPDFFRYSFSVCLEEYQEKKEGYDIKKCEGKLNGISEKLLILNHLGAQILSIEISHSEDSKNSPVEFVFLFIEGGPLHRYDRVNEAGNFYSGLPKNSILVNPLYQGTWYKSSGDAVKDIERAKFELDGALSELRRIHNSARFIIIGESWGAFFASRLNLSNEDTLVLLSSPIGHTGKSLLDFFDRRSSERQKRIDSTFALSADDARRQVSVNRFNYIRESLNYVGNEHFVYPRRAGYDGCRVIIYGKEDPMIAGVIEEAGVISESGDLVISRDAGHDVVTDFEGFFSRLIQSNCKNN